MLRLHLIYCLHTSYISTFCVIPATRAAAETRKFVCTVRSLDEYSQYCCPVRSLGACAYRSTQRLIAQYVAAADSAVVAAADSAVVAAADNPPGRWSVMA